MSRFIPLISQLLSLGAQANDDSAAPIGSTDDNLRIHYYRYLKITQYINTKSNGKFWFI